MTRILLRKETVVGYPVRGAKSRLELFRRAATRRAERGKSLKITGD